jgi:hypothetical protein
MAPWSRATRGLRVDRRGETRRLGRDRSGPGTATCAGPVTGWPDAVLTEAETWAPGCEGLLRVVVVFVTGGCAADEDAVEAEAAFFGAALGFVACEEERATAGRGD